MSKLSLPSDDKNVNADFCKVLIDLAEYEKNVSRNIHKYNAYKKAAAVLASHHKRIDTGDEARKLKGIGDKIAKKLDELLQTGKLKKLENINQDEDVIAINLLTRVSGIGPVKAAELVRSGIKTLDDLKNNKEKLNHHQLIGLKYFDDIQKRIPRAEIQEIEGKLKKMVSNINEKFSVTICGSYRRGNTDSGDIDCLITHPEITLKRKKSKHEKYALEKIVEALADLIIDTIAVGETKFMGVCRLRSELPARRLDIRLIPHEQFHCAELYFTGSDVFNQKMRSHALEKGFMLNEYSLRHIGATDSNHTPCIIRGKHLEQTTLNAQKRILGLFGYEAEAQGAYLQWRALGLSLGVPGEPVPVANEEEVFEYIEYPYKEPNQRNY